MHGRRTRWASRSLITTARPSTVWSTPRTHGRRDDVRLGSAGRPLWVGLEEGINPISLGVDWRPRTESAWRCDCRDPAGQLRRSWITPALVRSDKHPHFGERGNTELQMVPTPSQGSRVRDEFRRNTLTCNQNVRELRRQCRWHYLIRQPFPPSRGRPAGCTQASGS